METQRSNKLLSQRKYLKWVSCLWSPPLFSFFSVPRGFRSVDSLMLKDWSILKNPIGLVITLFVVFTFSSFLFGVVCWLLTGVEIFVKCSTTVSNCRRKGDMEKGWLQCHKEGYIQVYLMCNVYFAKSMGEMILDHKHWDRKTTIKYWMLAGV